MAEKKIIRLVAILLLSFTVLMVTALFYLPELKGAVSGYLRRNGRGAIADLFADEKDLEVTGNVDLKPSEEGSLSDEQMERRLAIKLPDAAYLDASDMKVEYDYLSRNLSLVIPGADEEYFENKPLAGSSLHIEEVNNLPGELRGTIDIRTDRVYEISCLYDSSALYIDFLDPHEVYDYVVVIDPGHGGRMPGTVKGGYNEKDINLAIALKLRRLLEDSSLNIGIYYTRTDDSNPEFDERVELANKSGADIFLSIHNNSLSGRGKNTTSGIQALYRQDDVSGESLELSRALLSALSEGTGAENRGTVDGSDVYIVKNSEVPVCLMEVGFMTNPTELKLLASEKYQQQIADALCAGIEKWLSEHGLPDRAPKKETE